MLSIQRIIFTFVLVAASCPVLLIARASEEEVSKLHALLQSDASVHQKAVACKRLAVIGTKQSVPVLARLLTDERLGHYARFSLEAIPESAVDTTFREALENLEGKLLVGVINSIGARRDAAAVEPLSQLLSHGDPQIASAAAGALGQIANPQAVAVLFERLEDSTSALQTAIADACLTAARRQLAEDQPEHAIEVYDRVRRAKLPKHIRLAATYSAIRAHGSSSLTLLREQLTSDDDALFAAGLQATRDLAGESVTKVLIGELEGQPPHRQALIIAALGQRRDQASLPALRDAARDESSAVKLAAIRSLQQLGDSSVAGLLLFMAGGSDKASEAARDALEVLPGREVDEAIVAQLSETSPQRLELIIHLVGSRRIASAVPDLLAAADSPRESIRMAAIQALGETIGMEDLDRLVQKVRSPATPEELTVAQAALTAACIRIPDREGCVEKVVPRFSNAPAETQSFLFDLLREVGGKAALETVVAKASDRRDSVQDAATRVLGEWLTVDAAPELLDLSRSLSSDKYKIRALRGYIRFIRQFGLPVDQRVEMSRQALDAAQRNDEKKLVLQALGRFPSPESLALAVAQISTPGLKVPAAQAAVEIAESLDQKDSKGTQEAMQRVLDAQVGKALEDRANALMKTAQP